MTKIFDGKKFAHDLKENLRFRVEKLKETGTVPKLVSILVGNEEGNIFYTNLKKKTAESLGIDFEILNFPSDTGHKTIVSEIARLGKDPKINGIMVQMPLPKELKEFATEIVGVIPPEKDVDGLLPEGKFSHPTAKAVAAAVKESHVAKGSWCVVVGVTGVVGSSIAKELGKLGYKIIGCNSKTTDLKAETLKGDVIVSVTGKPGIITKDMVKKDAAVIDVGYPSPDVAEGVRHVASFLTPVPGGIGPVTIAKLMENLVRACEANSQPL